MSSGILGEIPEYAIASVLLRKIRERNAYQIKQSSKSLSVS